MTELILKIIGTTLSIWKSKEQRKYYDKWMDLNKRYYEENNKNESQRDMAVLDNLDHELQLLGEALNSEIQRSNSRNS